MMPVATTADAAIAVGAFAALLRCSNSHPMPLVSYRPGDHNERGYRTGAIAAGYVDGTLRCTLCFFATSLRACRETDASGVQYGRQAGFVTSAGNARETHPSLNHSQLGATGAKNVRLSLLVHPRLQILVIMGLITVALPYNIITARRPS
eukprot:SAG11_NODE_8849_length_970_cov_1.087256_2_plen_150_part_00